MKRYYPNNMNTLRDVKVFVSRPEEALIEEYRGTPRPTSFQSQLSLVSIAALEHRTARPTVNTHKKSNLSRDEST